MATQITLGTAFQSNGKTVVAGGQSQIDTKSLVESIMTAKRAPAVKLETANTTLDKQTTELGTLKSLLAKFQTAADTLRSPPGVGNQSKNIFEYRIASSTTDTGATASNYVDIAVQPGAAIQSFKITNIQSVAKQTKQVSGVIPLADITTASAVTASGSPTANFFSAGTVNLRAVDGSASVAVTLNAGDSLQTVVNRFNEVKTRTGIQASIIQVSTGNYQVAFSATKTGTTYGFDLGLTSPTAGAGVVSDASGVLSQLTYTSPQLAQNAQFTVDGVTVTREQNSVSDVLTGITFNLKQPTLGVPQITTTVQADTELVQNAITNFADAYNEFRLFASTQTELGDDGLPKDTAILNNNGTFRRIVEAVNTEVSRIVSGVSSVNPSRLIDIGISLDSFAGDDKNPATKNIMTVDTDKLSSMLSSNYDGVRGLFEYQMTSDNSNFITFSRSNQLDASAITFNIDRTTGTYTATLVKNSTGATETVTLDGTAQSGGAGITLKGQSGTSLAGMTFIYAAAGDATPKVTITQGFADRYYNQMDGFINTTDGLVTKELTDISDTQTRNKTEITKLDDTLSKYRDKLVQQYADLEAALSKANGILQLIDAQNQARNSNS